MHVPGGQRPRQLGGSPHGRVRRLAGLHERLHGRPCQGDQRQVIIILIQLELEETLASDCALIENDNCRSTNYAVVDSYQMDLRVCLYGRLKPTISEVCPNQQT